MTDEEQPSAEPVANEQPIAEQPAAAEPAIDDARRYTTREAGDLLGLRWRTVVEYIRRGHITAEREVERTAADQHQCRAGLNCAWSCFTSRFCESAQGGIPLVGQPRYVEVVHRSG